MRRDRVRFSENRRTSLTGNLCPALTTIGAGDYLLIWADNDVEDNGTVASDLHAAFEINADAGDQSGLFDGYGTTLIDGVEFPDQDPNISYGRYPDANDTWRFFALPTPKRMNIGAYPGQVADTKFSHNRGFYNTPFTFHCARAPSSTSSKAEAGTQT